jgi:hypothetical protein
VCEWVFPLSQGYPADNSRVGELSQDALVAIVAVGAGVGEEVNSRDGGGVSDGTGVGGVRDMFLASRGPFDKVNSKLVSLNWFCIAWQCFR